MALNLKSHPFLLSLFLFSCLIVNPVLCQESQGLNLSVGLMTETLTHPGLSIGIRKSLSTPKVKEKNRRKGTYEVSKDFFVLSNIGVYQHFRNHTGLLYSISIVRRRKADDLRLTQSYGIRIGGLTQFNAGITYELNKNEEIEESRLQSRTYFHPHLLYELGYPFSAQIKGYTRLQLGVKTPYNTYFSIVPIIETGVSFSLRKDKE